MNSTRIFFILACLSFNLSGQVTSSTKNNGNLILEDIPPIPDEIVKELNRFQNVRSGSFRGFTNSGSELFISTRFGNVSQLHLVKTPGGARKQITYFVVFLRVYSHRYLLINDTPLHFTVLQSEMVWAV